LLRTEALDWLFSQRRPGRWAVLPKITPERVEPLLAVYEPEALGLLERLAARGCNSPSQLAAEPNVYMPTPPASLHNCWRNINTPQELRRLELEAAQAQGRCDHDA
jgi:molybdopterin-guanine dinucleotide biosynthesis protein A